MKKIVSAALAALWAAGMFFGCALPTAGPQRFTYTAWDVFDTVTSIVGYADTEAEWDRQMQALHEDLVYYHRLFDIYNEYDGLNNLCTVNRNAGVQPVSVERPIIDLLLLARDVYELTGGKTNAAAGSVLRIWHDYRTEGLEDPASARLPSMEELEQAAEHCRWEDVVIDEEAGTVYLADPQMSLDVGSIGKGYAAELAARAAQERGLTSASLSLGGNLRAIGTKPGDQPWVGGVEDPWNSSETFSAGSLYAVDLQDSALVISGNYQRYYTVDGQRYHHLIDPDTLMPADYCSAVCVLCPDSGLADGLSTGLFCMSVEEGLALVESLDGVEAVWMLPDQTTVMSSGFSAHLHASE